MKVLVTGACGQLGMSLRRVMPPSVSAVYTDVVEAPDTRFLDITDLEAIRRLVAEEKVDVIVNCAAYTRVDDAEDQSALAEALNAGAVAHLAQAMQESGGRMIHISTDYVFGGNPGNTPIAEDATPSPLGVYGRTKWQGEQALLHIAGERAVIIRTGWLYSEYGTNFVKTMLRLTAEKPSLRVVFDQVGTPTYASDLARVIVRILTEFPALNGIFHYSNEGVCSWYDFARTIAAMAGHEGCEIMPCHSSEFPSKARRPAYSVLDKSRIKEALGIRIPYWTDSLKGCIQRLTER